MKIQRWTKSLSAALAASGVACGELAQAETILTGLTATNDTVPADHGSNAPGTPNVALVWDDGWDQYDGWPNDSGDGVYQVDGDSHNIVFNPALGVQVSLSSFDLNVWAGGGETSVDWRVEGDGGVLGAGTTVTADGTVSTTAIDVTGSAGESLVLYLDQTSGVGSYLAMDNLVFNQAGTPIPEPLGGMIALTGLGALAMRRRRD